MIPSARFMLPVVALGVLALGGCRDKHEPVKPTVSAGQGMLPTSLQVTKVFHVVCFPGSDRPPGPYA